MRWLLLLALLGASGASEARMHHPYRGHRIVPVASAPLDGFTTPSGAYSFRKLKSTYSGSAIRIRRASDNAELDIGFLGFTSFTGAPWDEAAAVAHCAATSCFVKTMYDQSGNARDVVNATAANQPALNFSCNGPNKPCAELLDSTDLMSGSATPGPATGVVSIGGVFRRTTGVGLCSVLRQNGLASSNRIQTANGIANTWTLAGGTSGTINATAADAAWHTTAGVINGASSSLTIDGTTTAGGAVGNTAAGVLVVSTGTTATTCSFAEGVFWDNYVLPAAEIAVLNTNQRSFWGF